MMALAKWFIWLVTLPVTSGKLRGRLRNDAMSWFLSLPARRRAKKIGAHFYCGGPVHVTRKTEIGHHVSLQGMWASGNGRLIFGDWVVSGDGLRIFTRNHNYHGDAIPYDKTFIAKDVIVGDFVWLGVQVILLPGTHIGEGAIIQAGSVVHGEIPPLAIAGGNPAKVFAWRDREHFERCKAEKRFNNR